MAGELFDALRDQKMRFDEPELTITDNESSLLICARVRRSWLTAIGISGFSASFAYLLFHRFASTTSAIAFSAFVAAFIFLLAFGETVVRLRVTNLDFEPSSEPSVPRMSTRGLEHRLARRNDESPGLYAGNNCLLPNVTEEQAAMIIDRIYQKFPDTPTFEDPYGKSFTTLNLK